MSVDVVMNEKYSVTKTEEYQCTWIHKVSPSRNYGVGQNEDSPKFFTGTNKWDIELYFGGFSNDSKDYVSCRPYLHNGGKMSQNFEVTITLCIIDQNSIEYFKQTLSKVGASNSGPCFERLVKRDLLLSSSHLLPDDKLTLLCRFSYNFNTIIQIRFPEISDKSWCTLQYRNVQMSNYEQIFDSPDFSDFQLNVGDTKFKVHKCVLAAHSPIFATMFRTDMLEKAKNEANIEDVEVNVMRQLLRFIYVGEVEDIDDFADKLFIAADKYQVLQLKELCEEKLQEQLRIGNIDGTLQFVDKFDTTILKDAAIKFIASNAVKLSAMDDFEKSIQSLSSILLAQVVRALMRKIK